MMKLIVAFFGLFLLLAVLAIVWRTVWKRHSEKEFFGNIGLKGYDGRFPKYRGQYTVNRFLKRIRFKSRIPPDKWEKAKPDIEMFYNKRVYKIEPKENDIRTIDIFLIEEQLPNYIEWKDDFMVDGRRFAIGVGYCGKVIWDCTVLPHGLIAGASSAGKTSIIRSILHQAIIKKWNILIFDLKCGGDYASAEQEAQKYRDLEQGYGPFIISDPEEARQLLLALTIEVKSRLGAFKEAGVSNITEYNASRRGHFVPWLVVLDEAAELLDAKAKDKAEKEMYAEIDHYLRTLARISRAAGVHILMGFIRPSSDVLDGQIKNNLLWRCCGYFADSAASRIVLENDRATELSPEIKGRFIVGDEETQAYYLPIPKDSGKASDMNDDGDSGGEAEREPAEPPAAESGGAT
ncbi:MAG: hypothetical protein HDT38_02720 [Clostridiales bacterium]|nr:hypothetical protein [Clostridiales bacterium]